MQLCRKRLLFCGKALVYFLRVKVAAEGRIQEAEVYPVPLLVHFLIDTQNYCRRTRTPHSLGSIRATKIPLRS